MPKQIKLLYFDRHSNMGDALNINLCKSVFGFTSVQSWTDNCEAVFIGSILQFFLMPNETVNEYRKSIPSDKLSTIHVWGSGFISPPEDGLDFIRPVYIHALRGVKTKEKCEYILKKKLDEVVLCDPGLLASELVPSGIVKKYDFGIVPHYVDKKNEVFESITIPNSTVIDIQSDVVECITKIAQCKTIISSSLHGLIVADSFGIPNIRMICSDRIRGGDYKFDDYYSAFGISEHNKIDIRGMDVNSIEIQSIINEYKITPELVVQKKKELIESFPFK
ncbi:MAG: hypothetical protein A2Y15_01880 [Clostridiales bacterium GWF2_36_10]|nr:MAG: hypothetical protein A2Y15_01880 [Clostridiales bacterium GWF2_36_10]HAN21586.1 hypothetical protein [Clostridiales bacterium]